MDGMHSMMHNDSMDMGDMGGMTMYFHFGYDEDSVLFKFWSIKSIGGTCANRATTTSPILSNSYRPLLLQH
jgi:hypothetical protein